MNQDVVTRERITLPTSQRLEKLINQLKSGVEIDLPKLDKYDIFGENFAFLTKFAYHDLTQALIKLVPGSAPYIFRNSSEQAIHSALYWPQTKMLLDGFGIRRADRTDLLLPLEWPIHYEGHIETPEDLDLENDPDGEAINSAVSMYIQILDDLEF